MPSRESVSETIRARTEFITAVRTGIEALMGRCGYSRERATLVLLKELNRGENGPDSKPTDNEVCSLAFAWTNRTNNNWNAITWFTFVSHFFLSLFTTLLCRYSMP
jgi:hypothetical protein